MVTTRTVYRLMIQDANLGNLLPDPTGPNCASPELAKVAELKLRDDENEKLVVVQVDQRKGGDGCWHTTELTVVEVL